MDALSLHLSFQLIEDPIKSEECWAILNELPSKCIGDVTQTSDVKTETGDRILVTTSVDGSHLVMHVYKHGLVTMDIQFVGQEPLEEEVVDKLEFVNIKRIENEIKSAFGDKCKYTRIVPAKLKRGEICPFFLTGDNRLVEFRTPMKLLAEKESKWQNIKIYGTEEFGAMLNLDGEFNEWDIDVMYNPTLLGTSRYSYTDKTVLVLGGGGGGVLADLLKLSPKFVVLVEIDIEVFNLCREYLKEAVQELEGPNYKILIEDCQKVLSDYDEAGEKFDFIVNDLCEELLNVDEDADEEAESQILKASMKILAPDGLYLSRVCNLKGNFTLFKPLEIQAEECKPSRTGRNGSLTVYQSENGAVISEEDTLELIERSITNHQPRLAFNKFKEFIPLFNEVYCFYEVKRENELTNGST